jgi:N-acetylglucosamine kinase-like BadF-type ATPase
MTPQEEVPRDTLLLGIDGGGSKTRALITDRTGAPLGEGISTSSNYHRVGFDGATSAIKAAIAAAFEHARLTPARCAAATFGLAGVDRPADRELYMRWLDSEQLAARYSIVNDAQIVLAAGAPEGWGVALICGTGSMCYGRSQSGEVTRTGGWGYLVGDEGSGYNIAVRAIQLSTQTADGRSFAHKLLEVVLDYWKIERAEDLVSCIYDSETTLAKIAGLAPGVLALADTGDPYARRLLDGAAAALAHHLDVVVKKLALERPPVALAGGLLSVSAALRDAVVARASVALGEVHVVESPVLGAIALARRLAETTDASP